MGGPPKKGSAAVVEEERELIDGVNWMEWD